MKSHSNTRRIAYAVALVFGGCVASANAQEGAAAQQDAPAKPVNAWVVNCSSGSSGTALECQMSQNLTESKTGQRVLTVTIRRQPTDGALAMLLALPHGLFIPVGVTYQIDSGAKVPVAIQTSDQNGAYAAVPVNAEFIGALKGGTNINIGMESVTRSPVSIPVSLAGFTAAVDKLNSLN